MIQDTNDDDSKKSHEQSLKSDFEIASSLTTLHDSSVILNHFAEETQNEDNLIYNPTNTHDDSTKAHDDSTNTKEKILKSHLEISSPVTNFDDENFILYSLTEETQNVNNPKNTNDEPTNIQEKLLKSDLEISSPLSTHDDSNVILNPLVEETQKEDIPHIVILYIKLNDIVPDIDYKIRPRVGQLGSNYLIAYVDSLKRFNIILLDRCVKILRNWQNAGEEVFNFNFVSSVFEYFENGFYKVCLSLNLKYSSFLLVFNEKLELISGIKLGTRYTSLTSDYETICANCNGKLDLYDWKLNRLKTIGQSKSFLNDFYIPKDCGLMALRANVLYFRSEDSMYALEVDNGHRFVDFKFSGDEFFFDHNGNFVSYSIQDRIVYRHKIDGEPFEEISIENEFFGVLVDEENQIFIFI